MMMNTTRGRVEEQQVGATDEPSLHPEIGAPPHDFINPLASELEWLHYFGVDDVFKHKYIYKMANQ